MAVTTSNPFVHVHELERAGDAGAARLEISKLATRSRRFDGVFGGESATEGVYAAAVADLVPHVLGGGAATCISYGQTGAGKPSRGRACHAGAPHDILDGETRVNCNEGHLDHSAARGQARRTPPSGSRTFWPGSCYNPYLS